MASYRLPAEGVAPIKGVFLPVRIRSESSYFELSKTPSQVLPPFGGFSSICNQVDNQECHHIAQNTCDKNYNIFRVVLLPERYGSQM